MPTHFKGNLIALILSPTNIMRKCCIWQICWDLWLKWAIFWVISDTVCLWIFKVCIILWACKEVNICVFLKVIFCFTGWFIKCMSSQLPLSWEREKHGSFLKHSYRDSSKMGVGCLPQWDTTIPAEQEYNEQVN